MNSIDSYYEDETLYCHAESQTKASQKDYYEDESLYFHAESQTKASQKDQFSGDDNWMFEVDEQAEAETPLSYPRPDSRSQLPLPSR